MIIGFFEFIILFALINFHRHELDKINKIFKACPVCILNGEHLFIVKNDNIQFFLNILFRELKYVQTEKKMHKNKNEPIQTIVQWC